MSEDSTLVTVQHSRRVDELLLQVMGDVCGGLCQSKRDENLWKDKR